MGEYFTRSLNVGLEEEMVIHNVDNLIRRYGKYGYNSEVGKECFIESMVVGTFVWLPTSCNIPTS